MTATVPINNPFQTTGEPMPLARICVQTSTLTRQDCGFRELAQYLTAGPSLQARSEGPLNLQMLPV